MPGETEMKLTSGESVDGLPVAMDGAAGVAKRVLFLVDRRALAAQAVRQFASFEPEPGRRIPSAHRCSHAARIFLGLTSIC